jgi:molybdate transport system substrate-binding protein
VTKHRRWLVGIAAAATWVIVGSAAPAEQVHVLSSVAAKAVIEALAPRFERATTHTVTPVFGIASEISAKIEAGEPFDVAILTPALLDGLIAKGIVDATSRSVVARSGLGFMIKAGAPKPDLSSVDAFARTVRGARAITYVPTGASGVAFVATVEKLGLGDTLKAKAKTGASGDEVNANVTSGVADLAVLPVSEILPVRGAQLGGVFPAEIQTYVVMTAGVGSRSPRAAAAREFVAFLMAEANTPIIKTTGMER